MRAARINELNHKQLKTQGCVLSTVADPYHKSHNAPVLYPTMHFFVTEMCTCVLISVTTWCIVGCLCDALWDLWDGYNDALVFPSPHKQPVIRSFDIFYIAKPIDKQVLNLKHYEAHVMYLWCHCEDEWVNYYKIQMKYLLVFTQDLYKTFAFKVALVSYIFRGCSNNSEKEEKHFDYNKSIISENHQLMNTSHKLCRWFASWCVLPWFGTSHFNSLAPGKS